MPMNSYNLPRTKVTKTTARRLHDKLVKVPGYEAMCIKEETWAHQLTLSKGIKPTTYEIYVDMGPFHRRFSDPSLTLACHACEQWIADGCKPFAEDFCMEVLA